MNSNNEEIVEDKQDDEDFDVKLENAEYLLKLLPDVFVSSGDVQKFDPVKIMESMIKETNISKRDAKRVTELVVRRIIASGIRFLSGPHIRELVCSALSELNFEEERKKFTRIGMPIYEYEKLLESKFNSRELEYTAPENIHRWAAGQLSSEYSLLKLLNNEQNRAHLSGDIHIHSLRYFDMRPYSQCWDIRMILQYGLPPSGFLNLSRAKPAANATTAILHACKWLGFTHSEFSGEQGYIFLNTFLAPYLKNLQYKQILQLAQMFIFEINQQYITQGSHIPKSSIILSPNVPASLRDVEAIGPRGQIVGKYGDFEEENFLFFKALAEIYKEGDAFGRMFSVPKHKILINKDIFSEYNSKLGDILEETKKMGTTIFVNNSLPWFKELGYLGTFFTHSLLDEYLKQNELTKFDFNSIYYNLGALQAISINLPRIAYEANGNDDKLFDLLLKRMEIIKDIFLIKKDLVKHLLEKKLLLLSAEVLNKESILNLKKQAFGIGLVGLNEMVKFHTNYDLSDSNSLQFSEKVLGFIIKKCKEYIQETKSFFVLWDQPGEYITHRFAKLDISHYYDPAKKVVNGNIKFRAVYYTPSAHLPYNISIDLKKKIKNASILSPYIANNYRLPLWMSEEITNEVDYSNIIKMCLNGSIPEFSFGYNFSFCSNCKLFKKGQYTNCPNCGATNSLKTFSKITDYYSIAELWNEGKKQELRERKPIIFK
ncbi:MAG: anaerobic ribonucleoside-triphosphate reductase [Promethearchaeota archaeon]